MSIEIRKKRILCVDDEMDTCAVIKTILEKEEFEVVSLNTGKDAIKNIELDGFDLLIFDIMMPDMSGWELYTRVVKIKPNYKIVFLSVLDITSEKLKELKDSGVKDYIKKPFDRNDFVTRVKKAINTK